MNTIPETYIAWHCRACGYIQEETAIAYSTPVHCRECGQKEVQRYFPRLKTNRAWRDSSPHRYDLCSNRKEIQVYLQAMDGKTASLTFDEDEVPDCDQGAIDVAKEVLARAKKYLFCSSLSKIEDVVASMEACHAESEKNRISNRRNEARQELAQLRREWMELDYEEIELEEGNDFSEDLAWLKTM